MFIVVDENFPEEQIGVAETIRDGLVVRIFNGRRTFILKFDEKFKKYRAYVEIRDKLYAPYPSAHFFQIEEENLSFHVGSGQRALVVLSDLNNFNKMYKK